MGQCGPANPCQDCAPMYAQDPRYVPDEDNPGSFRIAHDEDHRKRHGRRHNIFPLNGADRLPVPYTSQRDVRRRRRAKRRRRS